MRQSIKNTCLILAFATFNQMLFAQDLAFNASPNTVIKPATKEFTTNVQSVAAQIYKHVQQNIQYSETKLSYFNDDVRVIIRLIIAENGELQKIQSLSDHASGFETATIEEIEKLGKVTPIVENGKTISRYLTIPFVFVVD